ncbi:hypothetical protein JA1_003947 [Spathaspora sp. JA1]|nr:hypothetical protein JA1_003947 [Spathaspora sp. JA1]
MRQEGWLLSFPDEILNLIFYHFNQATTLNAMLVNKKLYQIGLAKLYRRIYVSGIADPPLSIAAKADTPFHRDFTIVNGDDLEQIGKLFYSKHMKLVRCMLFRTSSYDHKKTFTKIWPWIKVELVLDLNKKREFLETVVTDITKEVVVSKWVPLQEDNCTARTLLIEVVEPTDVLNLVPRMKSLENIRLAGKKREIFQWLNLSLPPLKIKTLSIWLGGVYSVDYQELETLFDLNEITSFELGLSYLGQLHYVGHGEQLIWLFSNLPNLKRLAIQSSVMLPFKELLQVLPKNTLERLSIAHPDNQMHLLFVMMDYMYHQRLSLSEFLFSTTIAMQGLLEEFDLVYKIDRDADNDTQATELEVINDLSEIFGRFYRNLRHIVLDRNHYTISWTEDGTLIDNCWLLKFPDEILDIIFSNLNQATTMTAMLVNKRLYEIGLRKLYRRIYFSTGRFGKLALTAAADTPFHREFTIINEVEKLQDFYDSEHMNLVQYILCRIDSIEFKQDIVEKWPWIKVEVEQYLDQVEDSVESIETDMTKELILNNYIPLDEDNYTAKSLAIESIFGDNNILDMAPRLKALEKVQISIQSYDMLENLKLNFPPLKIKTLGFWILGAYSLDYRELDRLFDFDEITSFEFKASHLDWEDREVEHEPGLIWLLSNLPNLKNLAIESCVFLLFQNLTNALQPNTLEKLYIACDDYNHPSLSWNLLEHYMYGHSESLTHFLFSQEVGGRWTFQEFDRIYNIVRDDDDNTQAEELETINQTLNQKDMFYRYLRRIVLDRNHYNDVLDIIFSDFDQTTTLNVMLVNRNYYKAGLRKLYRQIYVLGDQWPPLSVMADTPFHQEFTILNVREQLDKLFLSEHMNLVKYILCRGEQLKFKQTIVEQWPWIRVELEECIGGDDKPEDIFTTDFTHEIIMSQCGPFDGDNHTAKSLTIEVDESSPDILELVPRMKNLERVKIVGRSPKMFDGLKLTLPPLKVKTLSLHFCGVETANNLFKLNKLFDLNEVQSFEVKVEDIEEHGDGSLLDDLEMFVIRLLPNVKNLSFETPFELDMLGDCLGCIEGNTIEKLYVACSDANTNLFALLDYTECHTRSITHLLYSSTTEDRSSFQEFDRVYQIDDYDEIIQSYEVQLIHQLLKEEHYPKLQRIVFDCNHYSITRTKRDDILDVIFSHFNQATTMNVMFVNKTYYKAGLRKLYRKIYVLGDQWPPLSNTTKSETPFHQEFTILNTREQLDKLFLSEHMNLVKYILCRGEQLKFKQTIVERWPWIRVELEECIGGDDKPEDIFTTDFTHEIIMSQCGPFDGDNHTAKSLTIEVDESSPDILELVPRMKNLERVEIVSHSEEMFEGLNLSSPPLKIKALCLHAIGDTYDSYREVREFFDLNEIETFEFKVDDLEDDHDSIHIEESREILNDLRNVKNLSFATSFDLEYYSENLDFIENNTLEKLCVACPYITPNLDDLKWYMAYHSNSITHILFSPTTQEGSAFQEFDRVYKIERYGDEDTQAEEIELINQALNQEDVSYPKLRHIVFDRNHYSITRTENGGFNVIPMN